MLIEVHMLKNYPPVNLNRDESGAPKTCFFGGVQRGRISSQCLKRSWRKSALFQSAGNTGIRTRKMPEMIKKQLLEMGVSEDLAETAMVKLSGVVNKKDSTRNDGITKQIVFYSRDEIECLAQRVKEAIDEDKDLETFNARDLSALSAMIDDAKINPISADIAFFGRMVTSDYFRDVDASMQVAHAISTHAVNRESDYFTAIDDLLNHNDKDDLLKSGEEKGASMVDYTDYNSCCYYEYASIDTDVLLENLRNSPNPHEIVERFLPALLQAMAYSNPSGKQNTFAGQVFPDMVMIECKKNKLPLSYVNAYEVPVPTWGSNPKVVENSIKKLAEQVNCMDRAYGLPIEARAWFAPRYAEIQPEKCDRYDCFQDMVSTCLNWVRGEEK